MSNIWDLIFGGENAANMVLASPNGSAGALTIRALVATDFATQTANYVLRSGSGTPSFSALALTDLPTGMNQTEVDVDTIKLNHTKKDIVLSRSAAASLAVTGSPNITGSIQTTQLGTPSAPTVTPTGGTGTTWGYKIIARDNLGRSIASAEGTGSGGATLSGTIYNVITWTAVTGAVSYDIYRSTVGTGPTTKGVLGNVLADATLTYTDNSVAGDGTNVPTINTTGNDATLGIGNNAGAYFWGGIGLPSTFWVQPGNSQFSVVGNVETFLFYLPFAITVGHVSVYLGTASSSASQYASFG